MDDQYFVVIGFDHINAFPIYLFSIHVHYTIGVFIVNGIIYSSDDRYFYISNLIPSIQFEHNLKYPVIEI